ncbi:class I SAM-dependent methyltransferase [Azospirillum argentinense]
MTMYDKSLKIDMGIPGQVSEVDLKAIAQLAASLTPGSTIVELGSLYGRTAFVWSMNAPNGSKVFCVDPWHREHWIINLVERPFNAPPFSFDAFRKYTEGCPGITPIQGYSPDDVMDWDQEIDVYFDDSVHQNPGFRRNLEFWERFVKPGGIICGDDYKPRNTDMLQEIHGLADTYGVEVKTFDELWVIRKPLSFNRSAYASRGQHFRFLNPDAPIPRIKAPDLKTDSGIPTLLSKSESRRLAQLAKAIPANGVALDLGAFYGHSSWIIAQNADPSIHVFAIDTWKRQPWMRNVETRFSAPPLSWKTFRNYTAGCRNISSIPLPSPESFANWDIPIDLYFEDANHAAPTIGRNLHFWSEYVKPGGVICGWNYRHNSKDLLKEVDALASRFGSKVSTHGQLWEIMKPG